MEKDIPIWRNEGGKKELEKIKWKISLMITENKFDPPKLVIDTNVFVSGLNFKGKPREVLDLIWKEEIKA
jgi:hypothetical protein